MTDTPPPTTTHRIVRYTDSDLLSIVLTEQTEWHAVIAHSRFPHPLITVDQDADGKIIAVTTVTRTHCQTVLNAYAAWQAEDPATPASTFVDRIDQALADPAVYGGLL